MSQKRKFAPLVAPVTAVAGALLVAPLVAAAANPFELKQLPAGYMLAEASGKDEHGTSESKHEAHDQQQAESEKKVKEHTCAAQHSKLMQGNCGASAPATPDKPAK